jgi:proline iminopeptidase
MVRRDWNQLSALRATVVALLALVFLLPLHAADEPGGKTFTASGTTIYYEVRGGGSGTPLFIANGGPGFDHSYLHVSDVWDKIAQSRPVVFWDQRGNGRSGALKTGQSCTLADQIADLEALRAHLGYEKIDLLGHSWGGYLAMAYAARHPERIAHLVILDSAAPKWQDTRFLFEDVFPEVVERQKGLSYAMTLGDEAAVATYLREYMSMLCLSPEKRDAWLAAAPSFAYNRAVNQTINADLARFDLNPELPKFNFPTLVGTGRYDFNVAPSTAFHIHKAIPGSRFVVFERSGHLPFFEEPEAFQRALEEFLAGRS